MPRYEHKFSVRGRFFMELKQGIVPGLGIGTPERETLGQMTVTADVIFDAEQMQIVMDTIKKTYEEHEMFQDCEVYFVSYRRIE